MITFLENKVKSVHQVCKLKVFKSIHVPCMAHVPRVDTAVIGLYMLCNMNSFPEIDEVGYELRK
jgi:hypothetical protein